MNEVPSEIADVFLGAGEKGVYMWSKKGRSLPKLTLVGGYGTGKYVQSSENVAGVDFEWLAAETYITLPLLPSSLFTSWFP